MYVCMWLMIVDRIGYINGNECMNGLINKANRKSSTPLSGKKRMRILNEYIHTYIHTRPGTFQQNTLLVRFQSTKHI